MTETRDDSIEEYKHLYAEIGRNSQISQNVFVANVAVTSGLIGYGLDSGLADIFLTPFAIIIPSLFFLSSQFESTTRIAAYITVFHETENQYLNWETRWLEIRKRQFLPAKRKYTLSISGLYGFISLICILLALRFWAEDEYKWFVAITVPILLLVALGIRNMLRAFSPEFCESYLASWKRLKSGS